MLFNSIEFLIFLPIIFLLYWFVTNKNLKIQNGLLLVASYVFYGWWDWRFLFLIAFSSFVDFCVGIGLKNESRINRRKLYLAISIVVNIGFLMLFKYYNFFADSFVDAFTLLGKDFEASRLNIVLPVGISFYTFQTLSYSIDVYKRKLEATKDFVAFFAFVSFFPQLVAGPIERATNLLPQFYNKRDFDYRKAVDGLRQILWGLFKKMVIADNCARVANNVFENYTDLSSIPLIIGAVFFAFQIYGDFSGYSDIAIGTSRLFGFNLMKNFAFPYFSRDVGEFWRRWHISLSTWFRDYLYIPLGGSRVSRIKQIRNTFIIFLVSGFWHGANWTFMAWGFLNAIYIIPLMLANSNRKHIDTIADNKILPSIKEFISILTTFSLTTLAWIFFRSNTIKEALYYLVRIFTKFEFINPSNVIDGLEKKVIFFIVILLIIEWVNRGKEHALTLSYSNKYRLARWLGYYSLLLLILSFGGKHQEFIYFQF